MTSRLPLSRARERGAGGEGFRHRCTLFAVIALTLLIMACTAPPPAASPTASPDAVSPERATVVVERPTQPPPALTVTPSPSPAPPTAPAMATATASPTQTVIPTPEPERLIVIGSGNPAVNMRVEPGTGSAVVKSVRDGTQVIVVGTDREADGRIWRNVQDGDATGWIVGGALRPLPTPTVTPSRTPTSAATATPAPATAAPATPAPSATTAAPPATVPPGAAPERVEVFGTDGQGANLRAEPGTTGAVLQVVPDGTELTVIGPDRQVGGRTWRHVRGDNETQGWIVDETVRPLERATPTPAATQTAAPAPPSTPTATPSPPAVITAPASSTPTATPLPGETSPMPDEPEAELDPEAEGEEPTPEPERVEVYGTGGTGANLRARPGRSASVLVSVPDGSQLTIVGEDAVADGVAWRNVQTGEGLTGWLATEVIKTVVLPTPTPRPGSAGIGAPRPAEAPLEAELTEEQRAARPCRPGQLKGDAATGRYYPAGHPDYPDLLQRVRCFDDESRARASGFLPADAPEPSPSPVP